MRPLSILAVFALLVYCIDAARFNVVGSQNQEQVVLDESALFAVIA
jgi:hypothetical protein